MKNKNISNRIISFIILFTVVLIQLSTVSYALYGDEPEITAKSALLYELDNDIIIYEKNIHDHLYPASVTKVMTALLALENCKPDDIVTVTKSALDAVTPQSSIAGLKVGEKLSVHDLLICLLVPSGNDAANVLAEHVGGTIGDFVDMMNERAKELNCKDTNYVNPSGLHDEEHYTSAYDILLVTKEAIKYDLFNKITSSAQLSVPPTDIVKEERIFNSTNYLLSSHYTSKYLYEYAIGTKTGRTTPAGNCLVGMAKKDGTTLISVVLGAETVPTSNGGADILSFSETRKLFKWGYKNFNYKSIVKPTDAITEVKVNLAEAKDYVVLIPNGRIDVYLHKNTKTSDFDIRYTVNENITAPIKQGDVLGKLSVYQDSENYGSLDLIAMNDVERSDILYYFDQFNKFISNPWVKLSILGIVIVIIIFVIYMVLINMRKQRRRSSMRRRRRY